jgi:thiol-disulfide isomerase/thioredoxin
MLPIITEIKDRTHFVEILQTNPGAVIIKFGANWCGPCKMIENQVHMLMNMMPNNVQSIIVDVDECVDLYSFLKSKKMVNGIPVILVYYKGNLNYIPDDRVVGADKTQIAKLFTNVVDNVTGKK